MNGAGVRPRISHGFRRDRRDECRPLLSASERSDPDLPPYARAMASEAGRLPRSMCGDHAGRAKARMSGADDSLHVPRKVRNKRLNSRPSIDGRDETGLGRRPDRAKEEAGAAMRQTGQESQATAELSFTSAGYGGCCAGEGCGGRRRSRRGSSMSSSGYASAGPVWGSSMRCCWS